MKNTIQITIPKPCYENWQQMTIVDKGRFCSSCQKKVIDFTNISDREIVNIFNKNDNLCGRFSAVQLNRDIFTPKEKSSIWMAASAAVVSFFTIGNQEIVAQEVAKTEQTDVKVLEQKPEINSNEERIITGMVYDDNISPLPDVKIKIKNKEYQTQVDNNGKFTISAKTGEILIFSSDGFEIFEIRVLDNKDKYNVYLESNKITLKTETIIVGAIAHIEKKRTFFGRIFHKIGNWFK